MKLIGADAEDLVIELKRTHQTTWRDKGNLFWLLGLLEEIWELLLSLLKLHRHEPKWELRQISSIAMNWLEKIQEEEEKNE